VAKRAQRLRLAVEVARVARRSKLIRVLRQVTVAGDRPAAREAAQEFRQGLEELGTTYVKLGQLLSRPDLLPDVYIEELSKLVDDAPPVPFEQIRQTIDEELGNDVFASIDPEPLASASIAQVHTALLREGREVVVKVRRPGVLE
jgi:ubiquinone biosynthesis protein